MGVMDGKYEAIGTAATGIGKSLGGDVGKLVIEYLSDLWDVAWASGQEDGIDLGYQVGLNDARELAVRAELIKIGKDSA